MEMDCGLLIIWIFLCMRSPYKFVRRTHFSIPTVISYISTCIGCWFLKSWHLIFYLRRKEEIRVKVGWKTFTCLSSSMERSFTFNRARSWPVLIWSSWCIGRDDTFFFFFWSEFNVQSQKCCVLKWLLKDPCICS